MNPYLKAFKILVIDRPGLKCSHGGDIYLPYSEILRQEKYIEEHNLIGNAAEKYRKNETSKYCGNHIKITGNI